MIKNRKLFFCLIDNIFIISWNKKTNPIKAIVFNCDEKGKEDKLYYLKGITGIELGAFAKPNHLKI